MGEFSITHLLIIGLIFLMFFGPSRLPQLGQSLGKAIRGFKTGLSEIDVDAKDVHDTPAATASTATPRPADQQLRNQAQSMNQSMNQTMAEPTVEEINPLKKPLDSNI